mmetsp:Transcript_40972/g.41843  ORF Transcript_40972/g.41843 Transcript_40972/m.41843 type:complete len:542 (-) Transcript_40972:78-1703(-)|eukprot:CAMPEP_0182435054 /NCGR_PEP_ID=MMETSP1167-20130531/73435_1 /TAXON_ID=2988 /ORGANISM="Mallomonas Sp, Strain CCMP3275" /LENGTH=541 /DNA_ID=CAMNT_0024625653 /DNA_START=92 /DNA_END=1717 /DNA_ORIENTATION=-
MSTEKKFRLSSLNGEALSVSKAAWLIARYPHDRWADPLEYEALLNAIQPQLQTSLNVSGNPRQPRIDRRDLSTCPIRNGNDSPIRLYSEYDKVIENYVGKNVQIVPNADEKEVDALLLVSPVKDFFSLPSSQLICQFPFEGGLVHKDLLPLTVRRYCVQNNILPDWWLPCFDLSTEFHFFCEEYFQRAKTNRSNSWVLKPATGTRGKHHIFIPQESSHLITTNTFFEMETNQLTDTWHDSPSNHVKTTHIRSHLSSIASHCPVLSVDRMILHATQQYAGDRVAQLVVEDPLLVNGYKFDLRLFVVVRSFVPFEAYVHNLFYARLAPHKYSEDIREALEDPLAAITVCAYNESDDIADQQKRMRQTDLKEALRTDRPEIADKWEDVIASVYSLVRELLSQCADSIGQWPRSRAYYGIDVIFDDSAFALERKKQMNREKKREESQMRQEETDVASYNKAVSQTQEHEGRETNTIFFEKEEESSSHHHVILPTPKLLEVNFMADWSGVEHICGIGSDEFKLWVTDMVDCMVTNKMVDEQKMTKL